MLDMPRSQSPKHTPLANDVVATAVEGVGTTGRQAAKDQRRSLRQLLDATPPLPQDEAILALDTLYLGILKEALDPDSDIFQERLGVLHAFLCTVEPTSTALVARLLGGDGMQAVVVDVLERLQAVLDTQDDKVTPFHPSFREFLLAKERSQEFYCDQESHHLRLAVGCWAVMEEELHFNMANIQDSSVFDANNQTLQTSVERNISPALRYACRYWGLHLTSGPTPAPEIPFVDRLHGSLRGALELLVLFWIETMNLLGESGRCEGILREAQSWIAMSKVRLIHHYNVSLN
jgi:hypothetical protein